MQQNQSPRPEEDFPRVLGLSNLFTVPGLADYAFNRQQLNELARLCPLSLVVPVPFTRALAKGRFSFPVRKSPFSVRWPLFWFVPRVAPAWRGPSLLACAWPALNRAASLLRPDVFLATWAHPDGWAGLKAAAAMKLPFVLKVHGSDLNELAGNPRLAGPISQVLSRADGVVAVSRALAERAVELGADPAKVSVVFNGVDNELFQPREQAWARQELGLPPDGKLVAFVGRLHAVKGLDLGLKAMAQAKEPFRLLVVGDGAEQASYRRLAGELGLAERVMWLGRLPHAQVPLAVAASDALVLPSRKEGEPNVVLEAVAAGRPVAANPVGSTPELITDGVNGFVARDIDPAALALALDQTLSRPWVPQALAAIFAGRTWRASAQRLKEVLVDAIHRHSGGKTRA